MIKRKHIAVAAAFVAIATAGVAVVSRSSSSGGIDVFVGSTPTPTALSDPCVGAGFTFCDEFVGSTLDTSKWVAVDNTIGNTNSFQCDSASRVAEGSGLLTETIASGTFTCPGPTGGNGGITSCPGGTCTASYQSGEIQTRDFAFKYGTVDVRAQVSGGSPVWPAIWLLGKDCQHPQYLVAGADPPPCAWFSVGSEEVDMPDWPGGTVSASGAFFNEYANGASNSCSGNAPGASTGQHTYSMTWTASQVSFKVDGTTQTACTTTTRIPSAPEFLILNNAMNANGAPTRAAMDVDWVHVAANGPNATALPSIAGTAAQGQVLTANNGTWTPVGPTFTYQWLRCNSSGVYCNLITGATSQTYTVQAGDVGSELQVLVTASNASGATQYGSAPTGVAT